MPASKPEKPSSFSIDEFIGEIEKAEDERLGKRLPQERLKNKRALDNAARRAAEAAGNPGKLVPKKLKVQKNPALEQAEAEGLIIDTGKGKRSAATGMSLKSPKSKANSVIRPTNLEGFGEQEQAGFGHLPSAKVRGAGTGSSPTSVIAFRSATSCVSVEPAMVEVPERTARPSFTVTFSPPRR